MFKLASWLLGSILLALCFMMPILYGEGPLPQRGLTEGAAIPEISDEATPGVDSAVQIAQQEIRDPFELSSEDGTSAPSDPGTEMLAPDIKVELQGIGFGSREAYAVIGEEVFYEGDDKNGIKLLEVRRREVDILMSGGKVTVPLFPGDDLQRSKDRAQKKSAAEVSPAGQNLKGSESSPQKEQVPL